MSEKRIGAYICRGCGIGERLDTDRLAQIAEREGKAARVVQHDFLCSRDGVETIHADLVSGAATSVIVCACSPRAQTETFRFPGAALARANLREGVIWSRAEDEDPEVGQEMADDYVRMACAESRFMDAPAPSREQSLNKTILVVGGGLTGLTAALESAEAGYTVTLVERTDALGGFAARLWRRIPDRSPYADPIDPGIAVQASAVRAHERIAVELSTRITQTSGAPGRFSVTLTDAHGATRTETFGAIIQATGFTPFDPATIPELGYTASPNVITQAELEAHAVKAAGKPIPRPSDGGPVKRVLFVQCAGQRSKKPGHLPYCSGYCCSASIKQALYFKDADPDVEAVVLYTDLRTPGAPGEDFYRSGQSQGVVFTRGAVHTVAAPGDDGVQVRYRDYSLDEDVTHRYDLVVLATGMVANAGIDPDAPPPAADDTPESSPPRGSIEIPVASILNLSYRQGTDLPHLAHGFADSHFICFPYETRRTGIYAAGPVRRPMDIAQAREDAMGAAMKAIQAVENAGRGRAAHPRSGDLSFPKVRYDGCTQCKRCTVECPFGAIDEDEKRYPLFNESRCRRCGTCMGACPVRVISFENYSIDTVGQQIKNVRIPEESEGKPRVLVLACENDAYPALDMAAKIRRRWSAYARIIPIRCLGSVNAIWVTDALNSGYDGVVLMGCRSGENYQCHFVKGSEMAQDRMTRIADTLQQLNIEPERVATHEVAITDLERAPRLINAMVDVIGRIGLSPFKF